jgi:hypothetical protein
MTWAGEERETEGGLRPRRTLCESRRGTESGAA